MGGGQQQGGGGQTSTGGAAVAGAASGASMGAMLGPWGAAVGAVGGAAMGIIGSRAANKANKAYEDAQKNAQDALIAENRKRATTDYLRQVRLEQLTAQQETEAMAEENLDVKRQTSATSGTAIASAAERGVSGNSLETVLNDYEFQQNQELGRLQMNQSMKDKQHGENIQGYMDQFDYRVGAVKPYIPRQQPPVDYLGPAFQVLSTGSNIMMAKGAGKAPGA